MPPLGLCVASSTLYLAGCSRARIPFPSSYIFSAAEEACPLQAGLCIVIGPFLLLIWHGTRCSVIFCYTQIVHVRAPDWLEMPGLLKASSVKIMIYVFIQFSSSSVLFTFLSIVRLIMSLFVFCVFYWRLYSSMWKQLGERERKRDRSGWYSPNLWIFFESRKAWKVTYKNNFKKNLDLPNYRF